LSERTLIVNADDFGRSPGVNGGVIRGHTEGVITSATLMVRWPDAEDAAAYARRATLGLGLHFDLGEWEYRDGEWQTVYAVVALDSPAEVEAELTRQLERFERLVGRSPDHLDSHQHVHLRGPARSALRAAGERIGVPVRELTPGIAYTGAFFGQDDKGRPVPEAITVEALVRLIEELPAGITELACHPAAAVDHPSVYAEERLTETATLCDPRVRHAIERHEVRLSTFGEL
jgi:predicted glycoside hydrolase/deacetylase ChbG (UPF0249 family)